MNAYKLQTNNIFIYLFIYKSNKKGTSNGSFQIKHPLSRDGNGADRDRIMGDPNPPRTCTLIPDPAPPRWSGQLIPPRSRNRPAPHRPAPPRESGCYALIDPTRPQTIKTQP
jgi:hypothetical protein